MSEITSNVFKDGLVSDLAPLNTPNTVTTYCLNGTLLTYNGNENVLQNDMGNTEVITEAGVKAKLPDGYIPVGMKEHGGIIYVASVNPETNKCQIGSFPSPQQILFSESLAAITIKFLDSQDGFIDEQYILKFPISNDINNLLPGGIDKFNQLWKTVADDTSDSNNQYKSVQIPKLKQTLIQYPLFLNDGEQLNIKPGDKIDLQSEQLQQEQSSNLIDCINSGQLKIQFVANTNYSGQYIITNIPEMNTSIVDGIGEKWYYKEPTSNMYLQAQFNIIKPSVLVEKNSNTTTFNVLKGGEVDNLAHILVRRSDGCIIPMENNPDKFTLTLNKLSDNQYTIELIPVGYYTGYTEQGINKILVNPKYTDGSISQWRYLYSNNSSTYTLQYDSDIEEQLQRIYINIIDISKLGYSIIQQLNTTNIKDYIEQTISIETSTPGVFNGKIDNLIDSHLYLCLIQKVVNGETIDIGYRALYACEFYNQFYETELYDYNNLTETQRTTVYNNDTLTDYTLGYANKFSDTLLSSYYYNYENDSLSNGKTLFGNWPIEKSSSNVSGKLEQDNISLKLYFNVGNINDSLSQELSKVYGGTFSNDKIRTNLVFSLQDGTNMSAKYTSKGISQTASMSETIKELIDNKDNKNLNECSITGQFLQGIYTTIDLSQSFFMDLESKSIEYKTLNNCQEKLIIGESSSATIGAEINQSRIQLYYYGSDKQYHTIRNNDLNSILSDKSTYWVLNNQEYTNSQSVLPTDFKFNVNIKPVEGLLSQDVIQNNVIVGGDISTYTVYMLTKAYGQMTHSVLPIARSLGNGNSYTISNILGSLVQNIYYIKTKTETLKANKEQHKYNNTEITISDINLNNKTIVVESYHDIDNNITISDVFSLLYDKFGITDISPIVNVVMKYKYAPITITLDNLNSEFDECKNYNGITNPVKYYGILNKKLFSPKLIDGVQNITGTTQINPDLIEKDHLGNVMPYMGAFDYVYITKDGLNIEGKFIRSSSSIFPKTLDSVFSYDESDGLYVNYDYDTNGNMSLGVQNFYTSTTPILDIYIDNLTYLE